MFARKTVSVLIALSFIFVAEAFAKKSRTKEDPNAQTRASQRLKRKAATKEQKKQHSQLKKTQKSKRKQPTPAPQRIAAQPAPTKSAPIVFKEPTAYYVNIKDLPKDQKKQAAKLIGVKDLPKEGTIKFAHSDLPENPTFQEYLNVKAQDRAQKRKPSTFFETLELRSSSAKHSNSSTSAKKTKFKWPWSK